MEGWLLVGDVEDGEAVKDNEDKCKDIKESVNVEFGEYVCELLFVFCNFAMEIKNGVFANVGNIRYIHQLF